MAAILAFFRVPAIATPPHRPQQGKGWSCYDNNTPDQASNITSIFLKSFYLRTEFPMCPFFLAQRMFRYSEASRALIVPKFGFWTRHHWPQINVGIHMFSRVFMLFHMLLVFIHSQLQNHPRSFRSSSPWLCSLASRPASAPWYPADHSPRFLGTRRSSCFPRASSANFFTMGKSTHFCSLKPSQRTQLFIPAKPRMTTVLPQPLHRSRWKVYRPCYFSA